MSNSKAFILTATDKVTGDTLYYSSGDVRTKTTPIIWYAKFYLSQKYAEKALDNITKRASYDNKTGHDLDWKIQTVTIGETKDLNETKELDETQDFGGIFDELNAYDVCREILNYYDNPTWIGESDIDDYLDEHYDDIDDSFRDWVYDRMEKFVDYIDIYDSVRDNEE